MMFLLRPRAAQIVAVLVLLFAAGCGSGTMETGDNAPDNIEFPTTEFVLKPNADTTVFGPQGTRIFIGAETFQLPTGEAATQPITVTLQEFYSMADILLADLSTTSGNKLLETAGMLRIEAFSDGEALEIKPNKRIVVHFPTNGFESRSMHLFYADEAATDTSVTSWDIDTVNLVKRTLRLAGIGWWYPAHDDSTAYGFEPKNYADTGYFWNPIDFYVKSYAFSEATKKELETTMNKNTYKDFDSWKDYGVECHLKIDTDGNVIEPEVITPVSPTAQQEMLQFLTDLPQLEPGTDKAGNIIERSGLLFLQPGDVVPLYQTEENYLRSFDAKYARFENKPIKNIDDAELHYFIFSVSELGWINCDRFYDYEETIDIVVETPVAQGTSLKLAFTNFAGVLKAKEVDGKYVFAGVPAGEHATLIALKNEQGQFAAAIEEIELSENALKAIDFEQMSLSELREALTALQPAPNSDTFMSPVPR